MFGFYMAHPLPSLSNTLDAIVFDAYGTLYDVYSVTQRAESYAPGKGAALASAWRSKQLEATWLRSLMGRYENFDVVTAQALDWACESLGVKLEEAQRAGLLGQYVELAPHPEVRAALPRLKVGRKCAILSNGAPGTLNKLVENSGLNAMFDAVISVDGLKIYKPDMRVYQLAVDTLGVPKEKIGFVSSNCWDAMGAKTFGFTVYWVNRSGAPLDKHGPAPDAIIKTLDEIAL
jgi:2-haloacid dehalogenase